MSHSQNKNKWGMLLALQLNYYLLSTNGMVLVHVSEGLSVEEDSVRALNGYSNNN